MRIIFECHCFGKHLMIANNFSAHIIPQAYSHCKNGYQKQFDWNDDYNRRRWRVSKF